MSSKQEVLKSPVPGLGHTGWAVVWTQGLRDLRSCDTGHSYHSWELSSPRFLSPVSLWHNSESFTLDTLLSLTFSMTFQGSLTAKVQLCMWNPLSNNSPEQLPDTSIITILWLSLQPSFFGWLCRLCHPNLAFHSLGEFFSLWSSWTMLCSPGQSPSSGSHTHVFFCCHSHFPWPRSLHLTRFNMIFIFSKLAFCFQLLPILLCLMWTCLLIVNAFLTTLKSDHCLYGHCQHSCDYHLATALAFHCLLTAISGPDSDPGAHLWPELVVSESSVDTLAP